MIIIFNITICVHFLKVNDQDTMKRTALHIVSEAGHASIVIALLNNNANFDAVDCEGQKIHIIYKCSLFHKISIYFIFKFKC